MQLYMGGEFVLSLCCVPAVIFTRSSAMVLGRIVYTYLLIVSSYIIIHQHCILRSFCGVILTTRIVVWSYISIFLSSLVECFMTPIAPGGAIGVSSLDVYRVTRMNRSRATYYSSYSPQSSLSLGLCPVGSQWSQVGLWLPLGHCCERLLAPFRFSHTFQFCAGFSIS